MKFLDEDEREKATPKVVRPEDVPLIDLADVNDIAPSLNIRPVDEALGLARMAAKLWYFDPGDEISYHAHPEEEELYYVISGEFSVKLGTPDDPQYVTVGPGAFFAAGPTEPHGHRCVGDEQGVLLALGAPADAGDDVIDPHDQ
ncbi:cupin domain-containing protein [Haladaptatus sp. NG-SE-30]